MQEEIQKKIAGKKKYLNFGCGNTYFSDWINIDSIKGDQNVINHNVLNGLPFDNDSLDVIYCSHVLEHFHLDDAKKVISECYRILRKEGVLRIVVPDLQNTIYEYLNILSQLKINPTEELILKHKWIIIELFDQTNRNNQGGQMKKFITNEGILIKEYIIERLGHIGDGLFETNINTAKQVNKKINPIYQRIIRKIFKIILSKKEREFLQIGKFRNSGEVHYWMYDKFFIQNTLIKSNFKSVEFMTATDSNIPGWDLNNLDIIDNKILHNSSIYVEAFK